MNRRADDVNPSDQRYWRRRANLRVRKKRRVRTARRILGLVLLQAAIAGTLGYGVFLAARGFILSSRFELHQARIAGVQRASIDQVRARIETLHGRNLLLMELPAVARIVEQDDWVRRAWVKRVLPDGLQIDVVERVPRAVVHGDGESWIVDDGGVRIRPTSEYPQLAAQLPELVGLAGETDAQTETEIVYAVDQFRRLSLRAPEVASGIAQLDFSRPDRIGASLVSGGPMLYLDPGRIERNIERYLELRHNIEARSGSLQYVDLRWRDRITVMPNRPLHEEGS